MTTLASNIEPKKAYVAHKPHQIATCVSRYLQDGNLDGVASMFHPDVRMYFPKEAPAKVGRAAVRDAFEPFLSLKPKIQIDVFVEEIIGDTALLRARWTMVGKDGTMLGSGVSTEIAKMLPDKDGWGYLLDCPNGPPEMNP